MNIDETFRTQLAATFKLLQSQAAANSFPPPRALADRLRKLIPRDGTTFSDVDARGASHFCTAAVDVWLRGVHSFLVSASLTEASPIWASVCGYYASHYSVRGIAHLLGYFQLFRDKCLVQMNLDRGKYVCNFTRKNAGDGEHKLYWKLVKKNVNFSHNELFTENNPDSDTSDIRHRNHANYSDHLLAYPAFKPLDNQTLKNRVEYISKIVFDAPPLPRFDKFPDVEYVQLIAYHRIVHFRRLLDEALGAKNRFWNVHRSPSVASGIIDFQLAEGRGLAQLGSI